MWGCGDVGRRGLSRWVGAGDGGVGCTCVCVCVCVGCVGCGGVGVGRLVWGCGVCVGMWDVGMWGVGSVGVGEGGQEGRGVVKINRFTSCSSPTVLFELLYTVLLYVLYYCTYCTIVRTVLLYVLYYCTYCTIVRTVLLYISAGSAGGGEEGTANLIRIWSNSVEFG